MSYRHNFLVSIFFLLLSGRRPENKFRNDHIIGLIEIMVSVVVLFSVVCSIGYWNISRVFKINDDLKLTLSFIYSQVKCCCCCCIVVLRPR